MVRAVSRILVIDDNLEIVAALVACLREQGYDVVSALTPVEALRVIAAPRPDLVLLDLMLPGMSGGELLRRIRAIDPTMRVIILSASTDSRVAGEAVELGALAYVDKPFDIDYLMRVIAWALRLERL